MDVALVTKHVMSYCQRRGVFAICFIVKSILISCTLLTRQSTLVLKVCKRKLAYCVTVSILAQTTFEKFYH